MKHWKKYCFVVNGFEMEAAYCEKTIENIFLPLLRRLTKAQKEQGGRLLVFAAAPPAVGKTTLCQFLEPFIIIRIISILMMLSFRGRKFR